MSAIYSMYRFSKRFESWLGICKNQRRALTAVLAFSLPFVLLVNGPKATAQDPSDVFSTEGLVSDLNAVLANQPVVLASGPAGSMNYVTAGLLCEVIGRALLSNAPRCLVEPTTGSSLNLQLLFDGSVDFALIQSDREHFVAQGLGPYQDIGATKNVRRVAAIAGLPIQVVVKAQGGFGGLGDLAGARIGLGAEGSAQRLVGRVVLSTAGVPESDLTLISGKRPQGQARDFCNNELDAIILPTTAPSPLVTELLRRCNGKLLPLESEAFSDLTDENGYLVPLDLPAGTYPNQPDALASFGYVVSLVSMSGRRAQLIETLASELPLVYGSLASRYDGIGLVPQDKLFDLGQSAPLHEGVLAYLDSVGAGPASAEAQGAEAAQ